MDFEAFFFFRKILWEVKKSLGIFRVASDLDFAGLKGHPRIWVVTVLGCSTCNQLPVHHDICNSEGSPS